MAVPVPNTAGKQTHQAWKHRLDTGWPWSTLSPGVGQHWQGWKTSELCSCKQPVLTPCLVWCSSWSCKITDCSVWLPEASSWSWQTVRQHHRIIKKTILSQNTGWDRPMRCTKHWVGLIDVPNTGRALHEMTRVDGGTCCMHTHKTGCPTFAGTGAPVAACVCALVCLNDAFVSSSSRPPFGTRPRVARARGLFLHTITSPGRFLWKNVDLVACLLASTCTCELH